MTSQQGDARGGAIRLCGLGCRRRRRVAYLEQVLDVGKLAVLGLEGPRGGRLGRLHRNLPDMWLQGISGSRESLCGFGDMCGIKDAVALLAGQQQLVRCKTMAGALHAAMALCLTGAAPSAPIFCRGANMRSAGREGPKHTPGFLASLRNTLAVQSTAAAIIGRGRRR